MKSLLNSSRVKGSRFKNSRFKGTRFKNSGVTLLEMMIAVAVLGVLAAGASIILKSYFVNEDIRQVALRLQSSLMMARSEAVKTQGEVDIIASSDGIEEGWAVTSNNDSFENCSGTSPNDTCILVIQNQRPVSITEPSGDVTYNSFGRLTTNTSKSFSICDPDNSSYVAKRIVTISLTGFPKITTDGDCSL